MCYSGEEGADRPLFVPLAAEAPLAAAGAAAGAASPDWRPERRAPPLLRLELATGFFGAGDLGFTASFVGEISTLPGAGASSGFSPDWRRAFFATGLSSVSFEVFSAIVFKKNLNSSTQNMTILWDCLAIVLG